MGSSLSKPSNSPRLNPRAENKLLQDKNMSLVEIIIELEQAMSQKEEQVKQEKKKLSESVKAVQQMKESWAQNSDQVTSLTRRNAELTKNLQSNIITIENMSVELAAKHRELQVLETKLAYAYRLLNYKVTVITSLMAQNQDAEARNLQQRFRLVQKFLKNVGILHQLNYVNARLVAVTQDFASVNQQLEDAKVEIRKLRNQLIATNVAVELKDSCALFAANAELQAQEYALDRVREESNQQKLQLEMNKGTINQLKMVRDVGIAYAHKVYNQMYDVCENRDTVHGLREQLRQMELSTLLHLAAYEEEVEEKEKKIESLEKQLSLLNSLYEEDTKRQFNREQKNGSLHNSVSASEAGDGAYEGELRKSLSDCGGDSGAHPRGDTDLQEASAGVSSDEIGACAWVKSEAQEDLHDSKLESSTSSFFSDGEKIMLAEDIKPDTSGNDNQPGEIDKDKAHEQRGKYSCGCSKKGKQKNVHTPRTSQVKKDEE